MEKNVLYFLVKYVRGVQIFLKGIKVSKGAQICLRGSKFLRRSNILDQTFAKILPILGSFYT